MFKEEYNLYKQLAEKALKENFSGGGFPQLESGMEYSLFSGGKRIRPVILLFIADKYKVDRVKSMKFAAAIEMIHTYSLIHDDLPCMDNDVLRRGIPTNHTVFGYGNAVLAGDALLNLAYETLFSACENKEDVAAARVIASQAGRLGMCSGQSADLYFEGKCASVADLEYINVNKTGALFRAAFVSAAILGNASDKDVGLLANIGGKIGTLFQMTDDYLDRFGNSESMGKTSGKDDEADKQNSLNVLGVKETEEEINTIKNEIIAKTKELSIDAEFIVELTRYVATRAA